MSDKRKRPRVWNHYLEYALVRIFAAFATVFPFFIVSRFGKCLAWVFRRVDKRHSLQVYEAVKISFPEKTPDEIEKIVAGFYSHLGLMLIEMPRLAGLSKKTRDDWADVSEFEKTANEVLAEGKGIVYVTGHIGNWELTGQVSALCGLKVGNIARPLDNEFIDKYINDLREHTGARVLNKFGAMRQAWKMLRKGGAIGLLFDQDAGQNGIFADFLGRQCSTWTSSADLHLRSGAPIVVAASHRNSDGKRHTLKIADVIRYTPTDDKEHDVRLIVQACNDALSSLIRENPEQWLWLHRRWKTQQKPKVES